MLSPLLVWGGQSSHSFPIRSYTITPRGKGILLLHHICNNFSSAKLCLKVLGLVQDLYQEPPPSTTLGFLQVLSTSQFQSTAQSSQEWPPQPCRQCIPDGDLKTANNPSLSTSTPRYPANTIPCWNLPDPLSSAIPNYGSATHLYPYNFPTTLSSFLLSDILLKFQSMQSYLD